MEEMYVQHEDVERGNERPTKTQATELPLNFEEMVRAQDLRPLAEVECVA